ncbi:DUF4397 domain-containing protein [Pontibacter harenae]|uniref:DUF4397 domain-containing protein n=1 Tax=Pontibacter harenae TaxID=2894083 RepID=UPI001E5D8E42|nr:DUF4397 domain-containing protein [Pontibacter harenae]MCC9167831.1 DUF4397 domain-containing protein [Pontibacter harenae]
MKNIINKTLGILAVALMLGACEKNELPELTVPLDTTVDAKMKFFFHSQDAPKSLFTLNGIRVTAAAPTTAGEVQGKAYGSIYPNNNYAEVPAGTHTLNVIDPVALNGQGQPTVLASTQVSLEANKNYSAYLVGSAAANSLETFYIEDKLPPEDYTSIWWRFVHTMEGTPWNVDVYVIRSAVPATEDTPEEPVEVYTLGTDIPFKGHGEYVQLKTGTFTWKVFPAGTVTPEEAITAKPYISQSFALSSLGRVYTHQIRGTYQGATVSGKIDYWRDR